MKMSRVSRKCLGKMSRNTERDRHRHTPKGVSRVSSVSCLALSTTKMTKVTKALMLQLKGKPRWDC